MKDWGTGGKYQQITQAVTGALQGLLGGDLTQALANGSAPFLAEAIKNATTNPDGSVNKEANLAAHAILGALLSQANGNSALAGGLAALTAEAAAQLIKDQLYGNKSFADLTEAERQNISALAQIVAAVAGGLAGDSTSDAAQGALAGKNAVENNYLYKQEASLKKQLEFKLKNGTITELEKAQLDTLYTLDEVRDALLETACNSPHSQACLDALSKALHAKLSYESLVAILNGTTYVRDGVLSHPEDYKNVLAILNGVTFDTIKYEQSINSILSNNPGMTRSEAEQRFDEIYNNPYTKISMVLLSVSPLLTKGALGNLELINGPKKGINGNIDKTLQADANKYFGQQRQYWSSEPIQFNGNKVYQRNDLFDPNYIDLKTGKTNLELMQTGRAPIGIDGKPVNLHHMTQRPDGAIAEVTQTFHKGNHTIIHINNNNIPSGIDRNQFNKWRANYWKERAKDF